MNLQQYAWKRHQLTFKFWKTEFTQKKSRNKFPVSSLLFLMYMCNYSAQYSVVIKNWHKTYFRHIFLLEANVHWYKLVEDEDVLLVRLYCPSHVICLIHISNLICEGITSTTKQSFKSTLLFLILLESAFLIIMAISRHFQELNHFHISWSLSLNGKQKHLQIILWSNLSCFHRKTETKSLYESTHGNRHMQWYTLHKGLAVVWLYYFRDIKQP